jgi:hypothetical protein
MGRLHGSDVTRANHALSIDVVRHLQHVIGDLDGMTVRLISALAVIMFTISSTTSTFDSSRTPCAIWPISCGSVSPATITATVPSPPMDIASVSAGTVIGGSSG